MFNLWLLSSAKKLGVTEVPLEVVNFISHATQSRLRSLLEKVSAVAQHRTDGGKVRMAHSNAFAEHAACWCEWICLTPAEHLFPSSLVQDEEYQEQTSDVRSQLRFFEQLERIEKQRKDEQEREILLKAAKVQELILFFCCFFSSIWMIRKENFGGHCVFGDVLSENRHKMLLICLLHFQSRARQEDPEQARLKQKAKEVRSPADPELGQIKAHFQTGEEQSRPVADDAP